ncbi:fam-c protein [Plasmodium chabaudi chabaudi]|uniref:Fam-c protein n=1 Tax=Plasmodium chabaudi chabaudi TaxID=31271 RepID=A0A4V0KA64_PLACU|nr:fam-c protein [Plasmodium chabaudi chabaudi]VTZ69480.1 fam-c protein [Plasmodium chabaudi chabaudi]|eukprot:XP_737525.2 fam-c protein [Plasmodium chabaudi chabaudi]
MNKRIFSYVCVVLYALLVVSIHCSEQKASDVRNKSVRSTKEISGCDEQNGIESKRELQLNNNNNCDIKYDEDDEGDIDDKDYKDEAYGHEYVNEDDIYNRKYVNNDVDDRGLNYLNTFQKNKKIKIKKTTSYSKELLTHPHNQIIEASSNNDDLAYKAALEKMNSLDDYIAKNLAVLRFSSLFRQTSKIELSNDKEYPPNATFSVRNMLHEFDEKYQKPLIRLLFIITDIDKCPQNSETNE